MKIKLLILFLLFSTTSVVCQVQANRVDDFEDGTLMDWSIGGSPGTNIPDGGPTGAGDNFLQYISTGNPGGPGSRILVINQNRWNSNYTTEGIVSIKLDVKVEGGSDLKIRFALADATGQANGASDTSICTTVPVTVVSGSGWNSITIPIGVSDFTLLNGPGTIAGVLANVAEVRILHNDNPSWIGGVINGTMAVMQLDNITPSTTLGVNDVVKQNDFKISPNPSKSKLNIVLPPATASVKLEVFDVLGKRIISKEVSNLSSSIDVSKWNNGVYLVRITSGNSTQTKRFVKQ